jgi:putative PEP-CTERM system integral membrane protein
MAPPFAPATAPVEPTAHRFDFPNGETVLARPATAADLPTPGAGFRLAVVLDQSRSMARHADDVATELFYFGGRNAAELLVQFGELRGDRRYDAVVVLTDGSGYELDSDGIPVPAPDEPVWLVHLGGEFPLGYDDATLDAIQASGGGVAGDLADALMRMAVALAEGDELAPGYGRDVVDGYLWLTLPAAGLGDAALSNAPIATRRLLLTELHHMRAEPEQLETLDQLHALAVEQSIVTPLSSIIVLVTPRQEPMLNQLEARGDRFEREVEQVGDTVPANAFALTGVPEPEEWLLLALVAGMVAWYLRSARRVQRPDYSA